VPFGRKKSSRSRSCLQGNIGSCQGRSSESYENYCRAHRWCLGWSKSWKWKCSGWWTSRGCRWTYRWVRKWSWADHGDPHYKTEDGKAFDFQGPCSYYLATDPNRSFEVIVKNSVCGESGVTCTIAVEAEMGNTNVILAGNSTLTVKVWGLAVENPTLPFENEDVYVHETSEEFRQIDLQNGISITWDGGAVGVSLSVDQLAEYPHYKTMGLIGTWNNNTEDDFMLPNGTIVEDSDTFASSWLVPGSCGTNESISYSRNLETIKKIQAKLEEATQYCSVLKSSVFSGCLDEKDLKVIYNDCLEDVATCTRGISQCLCSSLEVYAYECRDTNQDVGNWREHVTPCQEGEFHDHGGNVKKEYY
jgi:hypothetical protein